MKTILIASILLAAVSVYAKEKTPVASAVTNRATITNASAKADAWTGATHKPKKQK